MFRKSKKSKKKKKKKKSRVEVEDTAAAPQQVEENAEEDEYDDTISLAPGVGEERGDLMEIEFAFNDPSEGDFHSVRNLVRRSFFRSVLKAPAVKGGKKPSAADIAVALDANVSALADSIVGQIECCSLVQASKDDEEEDEFDEDETASSDATAALTYGEIDFVSFVEMCEAALPPAADAAAGGRRMQAAAPAATTAVCSLPSGRRRTFVDLGSGTGVPDGDAGWKVEVLPSPDPTSADTASTGTGA